MTIRDISPGKPASTARVITAAARRCFLDVGYEACSMDAIARHADVSKATLYAHFTSKEALFVAVIQSELDAHNERLGEFDASGLQTLPAQLVAIGTTILSQMLEANTLRLFRIVVAEGARLPAPCRAALHNRKQLVYRGITTIFADAGRANPEEMARLFMALIKGDLVWDCLLGAREPPQIEEIRDHIDTVVQSMMRLCSSPCVLLPDDETNHA